MSDLSYLLTFIIMTGIWILIGRIGTWIAFVGAYIVSFIIVSRILFSMCEFAFLNRYGEFNIDAYIRFFFTYPSWIELLIIANRYEC